LAEYGGFHLAGRVIEERNEAYALHVTRNLDPGEAAEGRE